MADMADVRKALLALYRKAAAAGQLEGKSDEAWCDVAYPTYWDAGENEAEFLLPHRLMIYSYALGPSRQHYIERGPEKVVNYYTWRAPDIFAKALEVIADWDADLTVRIEDGA
jgi:hypothetical protein